MKTLGLAMLAAVMIAAAFSIRSTVKLRDWRQTARKLSTAAVIRKIAPHVIIPVAVLVIAYNYLGPLVLGQPLAWNFRYVGAYFLPEVALLLLLAVVPDILQAIYMTAVATIDRWGQPPAAPSPDAERQELPEPVTAAP